MSARNAVILVKKQFLLFLKEKNIDFVQSVGYGLWEIQFHPLSCFLRDNTNKTNTEMINAYFKTLFTTFVLIGMLCLTLHATYLISTVFSRAWGFAFCMFSIFAIIIPALIWFLNL